MSPKIRQSIYLLGTVVSSLIGVVLLWGGIDAGVAGNLTTVIGGAIALLGAGAPAVAASTVNKQIKDGTLSSVAPADAVISGVQAVISAAQAASDAKTAAEAEVERVKTAVSDIASNVPIFGPLTQQVINSIKVP